VQGLPVKVILRLKTGSLGLIVVFGLLAARVAIPRAAEAEGARIAPEFGLSLAELQSMTRSLPEEIRAGILAEPQEFLHLVAAVLDEPAVFFVLVDKSHTLPPEHEPEDLVNLRAYPLSVLFGDMLLRKAIMPAVLELAGAAKESGITLLFSSGYRSFEYQKYVYAKEVKTYGQEMADRESAKPGASQHQLGTAIDFGSITDDFAGTRAGTWLFAHAGEHGFSLSYPQGYEEVTGYRYESWHYRYITKPGVVLQKKFFGDIQQYMLEFLNDNRTALESKRLP
jgi:zinc D-Ala-D-Ala carboxypeptidase